jgi:hypothetical protein
MNEKGFRSCAEFISQMEVSSGASKYMRLLFHSQCTYNAVPLVKSGPPLLRISSRLAAAGSPESSVESSAESSSELLGASSSQSSPGGSTTRSQLLNYEQLWELSGIFDLCISISKRHNSH